MSIRNSEIPQYSVVVPCYNAESTVSIAIKSIINQSNPNFELIIVDDCSSDGSLEIITALMKDEARIKLIANENNLGVADTKNLGMEHAKGEFIGFLDADDWLSRHYFKNLIDSCSDVDFVRCAHVRVNGLKRELHLPPMNNIDCKLDPKASIGPTSQKTMIDYPYAGTGIFRTDTLRRLDISFQKGLRSAEDRMFFLKLFYEADSYGISSECGYFYRKDDSNSLTANGRSSQLDIFKAIKMMLRYSEQKVSEVDIQLKIVEMSLALIHFHYLNSHRLEKNVKEHFFRLAQSISDDFDKEHLNIAINISNAKRRNDLIKLLNR